MVAGVSAPETRLTGALVASSVGQRIAGDEQRDRASPPRRDELVQTRRGRARPARRGAIEDQDDPPGHLQPLIVVVPRRRDTGSREHELAPHVPRSDPPCGTQSRPTSKRTDPSPAA